MVLKEDFDLFGNDILIRTAREHFYEISTNTEKHIFAKVTMFLRNISYNVICLFEALRPGQQFFSHFWDGFLGLTGMKCLAQGHNTAPQVRIAIKSPTLYQLLVLPLIL